MFHKFFVPTNVKLVSLEMSTEKHVDLWRKMIDKGIWYKWILWWYLRL